MFSFLIPVYNTKKYLPKCMESILCQTGAPFEIVLIDDGSTDGSGELCDDYARQYPDSVRVVHKQNEGLLLTRRRGFKEANGDWFICVDSDDYIAPELLSTVVEMIAKFGGDMVMFNFNYATDAGIISSSRLKIPDASIFESETKQEIYKLRLLSVDVNSMCMRAMQRDIVDIDADYSQCGIRNMCEDAVQDLAIYTNAQRIVYTSKPLYYYRKGDDSITAKQNLDRWISSKICFEMTEPYLQNWSVSEGTKSKFYAQACESIANFIRWLFAEKNDDEIKRIIDALRNDAGFVRCVNMLIAKNCSTKYTRFSVPKIMKYIANSNVNGIKRYLKIESKLMSIIKR